MNLLSIRHSTSALLAKAIAEMHPNSKFIDLQSDSLGFWCDVQLKKTVDKGAIDQIEERLLQLTAQKLDLRSMTMMRDNALELLKHQGTKFSLPEDPLVEMLKVGEFCCPCPLPHLENSSQIGAIKLFPLEELVSGVVRISGTAFEDKKSLKQFLKALEKYKKEGHLNQIEKHNLAVLKEEDIFWAEKGLNLINRFKEIWCDWAAQSSCQMISSPLLIDGQFRLSHLDSQKPLLKKGSHFAEWGPIEALYEPMRSTPFLTPNVPNIGTKTTICTPQEAEQELISSLHSIHEIIRMFDINTQWVWCGTKAGNFSRSPQKKQDPSTKMFEALSQKVASQSMIDFVTCEADTMLDHTLFYAEYSDLLGSTWTGPTVQCVPLFLEGKHTNGMVAIHCNLFGPVERLIALLLEAGGTLPSTHGQENRHRKGGN